MNSEHPGNASVGERDGAPADLGGQDLSIAVLLPILVVVFIAYLLIGIAMPVLPVHVNETLGLSALIVGIVSGSQFAASLITRPWAGHHVDSQGPKQAVVVGLLVAAASGACYLVSLRFLADPEISMYVLLAGRGLLGIAESFIVTGSLTWGLTLMGPQNSGKVMAWVGTSLYAALAIGAPLGTALHAAFDFAGVGIATLVIPLITLPLVASSFSSVAPPHRPQASLWNVLGAIWLPGMGLGISGVGFAAITTFVVLLFNQHGWGPSWLAFTLLSLAFIAGRLLFGHLPDRMGGAKVAFACVLLEALGLILVWCAPWYPLALLGVSLAGLGYSLVYPGFGVEAVRRTPEGNRGLAMGAYTAFLDLSLGGSGPALGLVAQQFGLSAVFLVSTFVVLSALGVAIGLLASPPLEARDGQEKEAIEKQLT